MAQWHHVLADLIRADRRVLAIKLLAEVAGQDLKHAAREVADISAHRKPLPVGSEYPDLDRARLSYYTDEPHHDTSPPTTYRGEPWTFRLADQLRPVHHRLLRQLEAGNVTIEVIAGRDPKGGAFRRGQGRFKAATELVRNGLAVEISRETKAIPKGGYTTHRATLTIGKVANENVSA